MRYLAHISYDGSDFYGYSKSKELRTIQYEVETALKILTKKDIKIFASGRTDAGVHAVSQPIHFDLDFDINYAKFVDGINRILPKEIRLNSITEVSDDFHVRHSVKTKEYKYIIKTTKPTVFESRYMAYYENLDISKIDLVIKKLIGTHDFFAFTPKPPEGKPTIKTIYNIDFKIDDDKIILSFVGNGFLRYMVRQLVGLIVEICLSNFDVSLIDMMFETRDRKLSVKNADACGLYLYKVNY
jgi:tRNA pseudouridine38-40 synthase